MSRYSSKISSKTLSVGKLNQIGKKVLKNRCRYSKFQSNFSIIFISDTHTNKESIKYYSDILKEIIVHQDALCIIHGGDSIHGVSNNIEKSKTQLVEFIDTTKFELYNGKMNNNLIPFFMNIGNHDYCSKNIEFSNIRNFKSLVGDTSDVIKIYNQPLDIILLDTGFTHNGFPCLSSFTNQIHNIEKKIRKNHRQVQYIIDMHIPPQIGYFTNYSKHTLSIEQTSEFINFLNRYENRIVAVVTHHIHRFNQNDVTTPVYIHPKGNIPFYQTSIGSHHGSDKFSNCSNKCLKFNFEIDGYCVKIKNVVPI